MRNRKGEEVGKSIYFTYKELEMLAMCVDNVDSSDYDDDDEEIFLLEKIDTKIRKSINH